MLKNSTISIKGLVSIKRNIISLTYTYYTLSFNKVNSFKALVR